MKTITLSDSAYEELSKQFYPATPSNASPSDDYLTITIGPESINQLRKKYPKLFYSKLGDGWYDGEPFANERGKKQEITMRKAPVSDSTHKTWDEQLKLIPEDEYVPTAREVIHVMVAHFNASKEYLLEKVYVRTNSVGSDGYRVRVGEFGAGGLLVYYGWDGRRYDVLGVSSARQSIDA